jgi:hypothetical protein
LNIRKDITGDQGTSETRVNGQATLGLIPNRIIS